MGNYANMIVTGKYSALIAFVLIWISALAFVYFARHGKVFRIKEQRAIKIIDEAVGRATEMGKPIVMNLGVGGLRRGEYSPPTIAGLTVLSYVAGLAAKYNTRLIVPMITGEASETIPIATEIVREAYLREGKADTFKPDEVILYLPNNASIMAMAERDQPAANIMVGYYTHESLIFSEAFGRQGAMQIGGTTNLYQIPFFAGACDYVLIGEEIFAAGAFIDPTPELTSSIAVQDICKIIGVILIVVGILATLAGNTTLATILRT